MVIKRKIKISIDLAMTVILPLLMAYEMIGAAFHELVGSLMFILFIVHNILNYKWFRYIFKGSYAFSRIFCTIINISIFVIMIALKISGIMMSRYVFTFFPIKIGTAFARVLHMISAYWGYILMSVHIGMHCNRIIDLKKIPRFVFYILRFTIAVVFVYGIFAFNTRHIGDYMFLQSQFVFLILRSL